MEKLPAGTFTFLFSDIEGSTQLWEKHPESMHAALALHDQIVREAIEGQGGHVVKTTGDGCHAAFDAAPAGLMAALAAQKTLSATQWEGLETDRLKVRMGLHTGEAERRAGDYFSSAVNRAARLTSIANGEQILLSAATAELVTDALPPEATLVDLGLHRLKDLIRPEHVFQLAHPELKADFPPLSSIDNVPNNLPLQLTSFIGREAELAETRRLLTSTRLVTLAGPGGTGKTRLSIQVAAELLHNFSDGAWLVELAPVTDPALVPRLVADLFDLREIPGVPLIELVVNYLRAKSLLLILDNCEHLVDACAHLAEKLIQTCPKVTIIATSREALGITGETVYQIPSLSLPDREDISLEALSQSEAALLFMDRATTARPQFSFSENDAHAIARICQQLDGIPLALEMAAARMELFTPEQIASRLNDRFRLLTGGSRTARPRQQTLRALLDWSYDLLSDEERKLLRRLSVFVGGWTFEAAEAVAADINVLDLLLQLIKKSLVVVDEQPDGVRYRMLEMIRQYGYDRLVELQELEAARDQHLDYFVNLAEKAEPELSGSEPMLWLDLLEAEHDNMRSALERGLERKPQMALRLAGALGPFWVARSYAAELIHWSQAALAKTEPPPRVETSTIQTDVTPRVKTLFALAWALISLGDNAGARDTAQEGVALARQLGDHLWLTRLFVSLGVAYGLMGDHARALEVAHEAEEVSRRLGFKGELGPAVTSMVNTVIFSENLLSELDEAEALARLQEAIALEDVLGMPWITPTRALGVSRVALHYGNYETAKQALKEGEAKFKAVRNRNLANICRSELAHLYRQEGNFDAAADLYRSTILEWQQLGHRAAVAHQLECFALMSIDSNQSRSATLFGAAEALREACSASMTSGERAEYEKATSKLQAQMSAGAYQSVWMDGRALTMEQAVKFALEEVSA